MFIYICIDVFVNINTLKYFIMTYEDLLENIGLKIKFYRQRMHLTQAEFSEKIDMDVRYLSDIECGKKNITLKTLFKLVNFLNIDMKDVL